MAHVPARAPAWRRWVACRSRRRPPARAAPRARRRTGEGRRRRRDRPPRARLVEALRARGDEVVAVSRRPTTVGGATAVAWEPRARHLPPRGARRRRRDRQPRRRTARGRAVDRGARGRSILSSRVVTPRGGRRRVRHGGPGVLVNASAVGYYGPTDETVDEQPRPGDDFLAEVCVAWERGRTAAERRRARGVGALGRRARARRRCVPAASPGWRGSACSGRWARAASGCRGSTSRRGRRRSCTASTATTCAAR